MAHNHPVTHDAGPAAPASAPQPAVERPRFSRASAVTPGYRATEVDRFVDRALAALQQREPTMTAEDVAGQRFRVVTLRRGYDLRQVDDWVDRVLAEVTRRRPGAGPAPAPPDPPHHVHTWWIYAVALVLVAVIVAFAVTQL